MPSKNQNFTDASKERFDAEIMDKYLKKPCLFIDKDNYRERSNKVEVSRTKKKTFLEKQNR